MCEICKSPDPTVTLKDKVLRRKKLWEIQGSYQCSILGTCLRRTDLRQIAKKKLYDLQGAVNDYDIHASLLSYTVTRCPQSRALNKIIDGKYRKSIQRYSKATSDAEILELWNEDVNSSEVAGAYWAVMTHPHSSQRLLREAFCEIHMLSHDFFLLNKRERKNQQALKDKINLLEEILVSERDSYIKEKEHSASLKARLKAADAEKQQLLLEKEKLEQKLSYHTSGQSHLQQEKQIESLKESLLVFKQENAELHGIKDILISEEEQLRDQLLIAGDQKNYLEKLCAQLTDEKEEMRRELISLETVMLLNQGTITGCAACSDQDTDRCPGIDLCGKAVLYVGGLSKMIPHYKQLVEKMNGRFLHHDGGKEESRSQLPKMLHTADIVFCPVGCVSHDATNCVKTICKRQNKPFVMMRSAGLSSFAKGITEVVQ